MKDSIKCLSELELSSCIYMSVGSHVAKEPFSKILERKQKEIMDFGWSLWAYSTERKLDDFCQKYNAEYVVMSCTGKEVKSKAKYAKKYYINDVEYDIPNKMSVTYGANRKKAQALYVEEYYVINNSDNVFIKSDYVTPEGYVGIRDIWPLIKNDASAKKNRQYKIQVVAKLKPPYSVKIV